MNVTNLWIPVEVFLWGGYPLVFPICPRFVAGILGSWKSEVLDTSEILHQKIPPGGPEGKEEYLLPCSQSGWTMSRRGNHQHRCSGTDGAFERSPDEGRDQSGCSLAKSQRGTGL